MRRVAAALAALTAAACAAGSAVAAPPEEDAFWHDVTLRLEGALPNEHPGLNDALELYLGRAGDGTWRRYVLGFSALFDPRDLSTGDHRHYSWMDAEGVLVRADEDGERLRLVVDMTMHPDPWVAGGKAKLAFDLARRGDELSGSYVGNFERTEAGRAGPAGDFPTKGRATGTIRPDLWPSPVEGHVPLAPGEHPRLMFRRRDLPALRKRMRTPEGRAMLAILEKQAGDGRGMGSWHGYAYGLLCQLTGEAKWAELARRFAEGAIAGEVKSPRYGWYTTDGGYMRVGPSVAAVAAAYDLCYDAWEDAFRRQVARKIQERIWPKLVLEYDLDESDGQINQRSNHYMLWNGGAGMSILAIRGDPGTDDEVTARAHRIFMRRLKRGLVDGFGDHGWFYEGTFCGRFPTNGALSQYIQAMRVAEGRDYVTNCSEARWLVTKWIYEAARSGGKMTHHPRLMYRHMGWGRHEGDFAMGFGIVPDEHRPSVLWFYEKVVEPGGVRGYDGGGPKQAAYAFVNWPVGLEPRNPAENLGHVLHDREGGFFVFRSGWRGEGDVVVSMWNDAVVLGMGLKTKFPMAIPAKADVTHFARGDDRTVVVSARHDRGPPGTKGLYVMAADFSGLCGAPALLVGARILKGARPSERPPAPTAEQRAKRKAFLEMLRKRAAKPGAAPADTQKEGANASTERVTLRGREFVVMTVQKGKAPKVEVAGEGDSQRIVVGRRTVYFDGEKIVLGVASPASGGGDLPGRVRSLAERLASGAPGERIEAAKALRRLDAKDQTLVPVLVPALVRALRDEYWDVRVNAAETLGRMGRPAVPALTEALGDAHYWSRLYAAKALGAMGEDAADAAPVLARLLEDEASDVRVQAVRSLARAGPAGSRLAALALVECLPEDEKFVKRLALKALARAGVSPTGRATARSEREALGIRASAMRSLAGAGPRARAAAPGLAPLMRAVDAALRREATRVLIKIDPAAVASELSGMLRRREEWQSIWVLKEIRDPGPRTAELAPALREIVEKGRDPRYRAAAAEALARIGFHAGAPAPSVRRRAEPDVPAAPEQATGE